MNIRITCITVDQNLVFEKERSSHIVEVKIFCLSCDSIKSPYYTFIDLRYLLAFFFLLASMQLSLLFDFCQQNQ